MCARGAQLSVGQLPLGQLGSAREAGGHAAISFLRGRPRGRLRGTTTPCRTSSPPQTPHGSRREIASARQVERVGQSMQRALARSTSTGDSAKKRSGSTRWQGSACSRSASTTAVRDIGSTSLWCRRDGFGSGTTKRPRTLFGCRGLEFAGLVVVLDRWAPGGGATLGVITRDGG